MSPKARFGTDARISNVRQEPFSLQATLGSYEVVEIKPHQVAKLLSKMRRGNVGKGSDTPRGTPFP